MINVYDTSDVCEWLVVIVVLFSIDDRDISVVLVVPVAVIIYLS